MRIASAQDGFSTVEVLVAAALTLAIAGIVGAALNAQTSWSRVQPAAADLTQRARASLDLVGAHVAMAGAGLDLGPSAGTLGCCLPAISPRRIGLTHADPPGTAAADRISVTFVPPGVSGTTLAAPITGTASSLSVVTMPPCPPGPTCGLTDGDSVIVYDGVEQHDYFFVQAPTPATAMLLPRQPNAGAGFGTGAVVMPVETHTYYFDAHQRQLRHFDGKNSDVPAIDNVVAMAFAYVGDRGSPVHPRPPAGTANCLYDSAGVMQPVAASISGAVGGLVDLPLALFSDGPWCGSGDNRFDLDLLRIRRVRMTLRLQAPDDVRSTTSLFLVPGSSRSALRLVPDMILTVDVTPRNLNAGR